MGKRRVIAETGAGQHGVATATACAHFGLDCVVYMGEEDIRRQRPNVFSMKLLGAEVRPVSSGSRTLRDAINEAFRDWMSSVENDALLPRLGRRAAPLPADRPRFPVDHRPRDAGSSVSSNWAACPTWSWPAWAGGATPRACSIRFVDDAGVELIGVEAGGRSSRPATMPRRSVSAAPACSTAVSATSFRTTTARRPTSIRFRPGWIIPGTGPEHSYWKETGRVRYTSARDDEALAAFDALARSEGILPALESSHAVAEAMKLAAGAKPEEAIVVCLSGRGDKDAAEDRPAARGGD